MIQHPKNDMAKSLRESVFSETLESIEQIYSILKISSTVNHSGQIKSIKQTIVYPDSSLLSSLDDLDVLNFSFLFLTILFNLINIFKYI